MATKLNMREPINIMAAVYGSLGLSNRAIRKKLGLSNSQIQLRLKRANVARRDYRDGASHLSACVVSKNTRIAIRYVKGRLVYVPPKSVSNRP